MKIAGSIPDFTGGLERALFAPKTSPRHYAAATRIKDVVQFSQMTSAGVGCISSTIIRMMCLGVKMSVLACSR